MPYLPGLALRWRVPFTSHDGKGAPVEIDGDLSNLSRPAEAQPREVLSASGAEGLGLPGGIHAGESHVDVLEAPLVERRAVSVSPSLIPITEQIRSAASTRACYPGSATVGSTPKYVVGELEAPE